MLYLLRQIRRKLLHNLSAGKAGNIAGTYLLYAIGEIILVVVGILIAVNIDDWSEQKKLLNQEDNYIKRLIAENKQDLENFTRFKQDVIMAMATIDAFCEALKDDSASDSLILTTTEQYMLYGSLVPIFNSSRSTFDDLSSTGNLKVISDLALRDKVVQHYAEIQKVQERMSINSDWALSLDTRFYSEMEGMKFTPWTAHLYPKQTTRERADELRTYKLDYINNAAAGYWVDRDAIDLIENLIRKTTALIQSLEAELGIVRQSLPDPLAAGWQGLPVCEVLQDNATMRLLKCTFPPGVGHERHYHGPHVGYTLAGSLMRVTDTTGTRDVQTMPGSSFSNTGIAWHEVLNIGQDTATYLIIEYK